MKRILVAGALALASAAPAFAADLPPPAAPPPRAPVAYVPAIPTFTWTGFYIGLNTGYAFGQADGTSTLGTTGNFSVSGAMAGLTLGGNYQIGQFVVGGETDIDWQNVRGSLVGGGCSFIPPVGPPAIPGSCDAASNWVGTLRARVGFAMDRVLLYATGGAAYANIKQQRIGLDRRRRRRIRHDRQLDDEVRIPVRRFPARFLPGRQLRCHRHIRQLRREHAPRRRQF
jgi:outer membrane immunogenic protein